MLVTSSCVSYFLQKPQSDDVTAAEVFSSRENAMTAIAQAYTDGLRINIVLGQDTPNTYGMEYASIANISGELMGYRYNWMDPVMISTNGMSPTDNNRMIDNYNYNFTAIRRCYTVRDNIDLVPDMSDQEKSYVKAEMMALVAYRYCRMLIQYGGVPIIEGVIDFSQRGMVRRPVKEVLQFIVKICDETAPALPNKWDNANIGRMTKGAALSIKAQALLYCARPLFNTNVPYMQMPNGDNSLICMNEPANEQLWEQARRDGHTLLLDGTNASDDAGDRPGMKALRELAVESPLRLCGLTKADVRAASKEAGLFTWDKPAYACLATRVPTGQAITKEDLARVEKAEDALFALGFTDFRVRLLADAARIQLPEDQWDRAAGQRKKILAALKPWFSAVTLDLETR